MNKGLEALTSLNFHLHGISLHARLGDDQIDECLDTVEKELNRLQAQDEVLKTLKEDIFEGLGISIDFQEPSYFDGAYRVTFQCDTDGYDFSRYTYYCHDKQEFELLKGALL